MKITHTINDCRQELFGIAAIMVVACHAKYDWTGYPRLIHKLCQHGNVGVDIFLLLSGMGLYYSMSRDGDVRSFYGRRLNRILPTFLLIGWPLYLIRGVIGGDTVTELFLHLSTLDFWVLGRNGTATWYVSFILLLYLAYPFLHRPLSGSRWVMGFLLVNAIVFAVNGLMAVFCEDFFLNYWEMGQTRIPVFLVGMIMGRREMAGKANRTWMAAASLLAFLVVYRIYDMATGGYGTGTGRLLYRFSMIFLALFISFFVCICNDWIPDNILRRAFLAIGSVSLELYLSHALLKGVFSRSGLQQSHNTPLYYLLYVVLPAMVISFAAKRKISIYDKKKICYNRKRNI